MEQWFRSSSHAAARNTQMVNFTMIGLDPTPFVVLFNQYNDTFCVIKSDLKNVQ